MAQPGYLAKSASLAGVSIPAVVSFSFAFAADRVHASAGTPWNDCDAMINARSSLQCEFHGLVPAGLRPGVKGATTVTPLKSGAVNGLSWAADTAIDLGSMMIDSVEATVGDDGRALVRVALSSCGQPSFVTVA